MRGTLIGALLLLFPATARADLPVGGSLVRADGSVSEARTLTVDPETPNAVLTIDGRRVPGGPPWRIQTRDYGDGPHHVQVTAGGQTQTADVRFARTQPLPPDTATGRTLLRGRVTSLANVGDVDGDGHEDILVGSGDASELLLAGRVVRFAGGGEHVAAAGDLNGDGYRDLLIGSDRRTYAVFGGPFIHSLDLRALGLRGLTIDAAGALATRRLGDFQVDGDVNGDGLDDIAIGEGERTAVVLGRRFGGRARPAFTLPGGRSVAFPGDVNHDGRADLLIVGDNGAAVTYGPDTPGFAVHGEVTSAGSIGDVDGDSTPDLLLGGPEASYVVFAQPDGDVDLDGDFAGFRIDSPPGAGPATVMGAGDLDGDYAPDVAIGFTHAAYVVFSPLDTKVIDLANLPGQQGARIGSGPAVDGLDAFGAGVAAALDGDPSTGTVTVATGFTGAGAPACLPNLLWSFPLTADHVLPRCRRANRIVDSPAFNPSPDAGEIARFNPTPACGAPSRTCQPTAYRSGNARISGPDVNLTTDGIVDLVDSYGTRMAAIQKTADPTCFTVFDRHLQRVGATCDPTGNPPAPHPIEIQVQGRACMATDALEQRYYLIRLLDPSGPPAAAYRELQGFVRRDQLSLGAEQTTIGGATYDPQQLADAAYTGCGPAPPKRAPVPAPFAPLPGLPTGDRLFVFTDRYVSNASFADCEGHAPPPDLSPGCYGPYANYQVPTLASKDPQVQTGDPRAGADWAALTVSSTAVSGSGYPGHEQDGQDVDAAGGGLVRAIVPRARPFAALDGFAYADPNVPCDTPRLARWMYGGVIARPGERAIYGWTPFRDVQGIRQRNGLSPACP